MDTSIHPTSHKTAMFLKKNTCLRDLDGAFRWGNRIDGMLKGGHVKPAEKEGKNNVNS